MLTWFTIFGGTLLFLNENCCLCTCFIELYLFYWFLEVSHNFNRCAGFFFLVEHKRRMQANTQNATRKNQPLLKITHNKTMNKGK